MTLKIDAISASSEHIEAALCAELAELRLARNISQAQLAEKAGIGLRTIKRFEAGEGTTLDTFIRVLKALEISDNLLAVIPDQSVRPLERVSLKGGQRRRARQSEKLNKEPNGQANGEPNKEPTWTWGD